MCTCVIVAHAAEIHTKTWLLRCWRALYSLSALYNIPTPSVRARALIQLSPRAGAPDKADTAAGYVPHLLFRVRARLRVREWERERAGDIDLEIHLREREGVSLSSSRVDKLGVSFLLWGIIRVSIWRGVCLKCYWLCGAW